MSDSKNKENKVVPVEKVPNPPDAEAFNLTEAEKVQNALDASARKTTEEERIRRATEENKANAAAIAAAEKVDDLKSSDHPATFFGDGRDDRTLRGELTEVDSQGNPIPRIEKRQVMVYGDGGDDVAEVQRQLVNWGKMSADRVTHVFDVYTQDAVSAFQESQNLPMTGKLDVETSAALDGFEAKKTAEEIDAEKAAALRGERGITNPPNDFLSEDVDVRPLPAEVFP